MCQLLMDTEEHMIARTQWDELQGDISSTYVSSKPFSAPPPAATTALNTSAFYSLSPLLWMGGQHMLLLAMEWALRAPQQC